MISVKNTGAHQINIVLLWCLWRKLSVWSPQGDRERLFACLQNEQTSLSKSQNLKQLSFTAQNLSFILWGKETVSALWNIRFLEMIDIMCNQMSLIRYLPYTGILHLDDLTKPYFQRIIWEKNIFSTITFFSPLWHVHFVVAYILCYLGSYN